MWLTMMLTGFYAAALACCGCFLNSGRWGAAAAAGSWATANATAPGFGVGIATGIANSAAAAAAAAATSATDVAQTAAATPATSGAFNDGEDRNDGDATPAAAADGNSSVRGDHEDGVVEVNVNLDSHGGNRTSYRLRFATVKEMTSVCGRLCDLHNLSTVDCLRIHDGLHAALSRERSSMPVSSTLTNETSRSQTCKPAPPSESRKVSLSMQDGASLVVGDGTTALEVFNGIANVCADWELYTQTLTLPGQNDTHRGSAERSRAKGVQPCEYIQSVVQGRYDQCRDEWSTASPQRQTRLHVPSNISRAADTPVVGPSRVLSTINHVSAFVISLARGGNNSPRTRAPTSVRMPHSHKVSEARLMAFRRAAEVAQLVFDHVPAIDGSTLDVPAMVRRGIIVSSPCGYPGQLNATAYFSARPGVVGCYFSHVKALMHFSQHASGDAAAVIFEDDMLPKPTFRAELTSLMRHFPSDWDIVLLHVKPSRWYQPRVGSNLTAGLRTWASTLCPLPPHMALPESIMDHHPYATVETERNGTSSSRRPTFVRMPFCVPASSLYIVRARAVQTILRAGAFPMITEYDGLLGLLAAGHPAVPGFLDGHPLNVYLLHPEFSPAFANTDPLAAQSTIEVH